MHWTQVVLEPGAFEGEEESESWGWRSEGDCSRSSDRAGWRSISLFEDSVEPPDS